MFSNRAYIALRHPLVRLDVRIGTASRQSETNAGTHSLRTLALKAATGRHIVAPALDVPLVIRLPPAEISSLKLQPIHNATTPGSYTLELTTARAVGRWHLRISGGPTPSNVRLGPGLASAVAMILVTAASVWFWRRWSDTSWKWFWMGAALWAVAVAVKFAIAIALNGPLLGGLKSSLPHWAYLTLGTIYVGGLTGITEVLFTFIAALIWPRMAATAQRAAAIGLGAGAFEAAMLALAVRRPVSEFVAPQTTRGSHPRPRQPFRPAGTLRDALNVHTSTAATPKPKTPPTNSTSKSAR